MRWRRGSYWTLIALLFTATAYAEPASTEVSKLLIQGGKERAEVVIDGTSEDVAVPPELRYVDLSQDGELRSFVLSRGPVATRHAATG